MENNTPTSELFVTMGILPETLPPVFSTKRIWHDLQGMGLGYAITAKCVGEHAIFNASKRGGQRRIFGIPHPAFIRDQAIFIDKYWKDISKKIQSSKGSASKPTFSLGGPRHVRITSHSELPRLRLLAFSRFKFCLVTDVARFFPSIYTHSIPWSIHGKDHAKTDFGYTSSKVYGNRLDFILRQSQSKQTIGIAVGPDTSKIVSELVMAAVDQSFSRKSGRTKPTFVRHVDDYWVAGNTYEECEKHLQNLRTALREYELDINETKTKIISTKLIFGDNWPFEFDKEIFASLKNTGNKNEALATLNRIVDYATVNNDDGIIRHAIRVIDQEKLWSQDWEMLQHFLAQCAVQFPHSVDYVARVIAWRLRTRTDVNRKLWQDVTILTINQNASIGRDSEVVWALWLMKELGVKVPRKSSDLILVNCGPLPLALLSHFSWNNLTVDRDLKTKLWSCVSSNPFAGSSWPPTLEMRHLGIADPQWTTVPTTSTLRMLHDNQSSIINWNARPKVFDEEEHEEQEDEFEPDFAIEDYSDDYNGEFDTENRATVSVPVPTFPPIQASLDSFFESLIEPKPSPTSKKPWDIAAATVGKKDKGQVK